MMQRHPHTNAHAACKHTLLQTCVMLIQWEERQENVNLKRERLKREKGRKGVRADESSGV